MKVPRQKSLALLAYLALSQREQAREKVAALLWPDATDTQARQAVRTALSDIRRAIGSGLLEADSEVVSLHASADLWIDVRELEELAKNPLGEPSPDLRFALFLEGFNLKGAPDYDDWAAFERDRLRQLAVRVLRARADSFESRADWRNAIAAAQQSLALDEVYEDTHRQLMRLHLAEGDRAAAIKQYEVAKRVLLRELGVEPLPETTALYKQILNGNASRPAGGSAPRREAPAYRADAELPFVGRKIEMQRLEQRMEMALGGTARFVFVEGEAGIGKTRFVNEGVARWEKEACVLRGTAHQLESNQPFHPVIDLLRDYVATPRNVQTLVKESPTWLSELGRLLPELHDILPTLPPTLRLQAAQERSGMIEGEQERGRLFEAISRSIRRAAQEQPLVLFVDDIQWLDPSSTALFAYLATEIQHERVLIVATFRAGEVSRDLEQLLYVLGRLGILDHIKLERLGASEVEGLTKELCQMDEPDLSAWLYRETEGNPFFIREMIAYLTANGVALREGAAWRTDPNQLASRLPEGVLPTGVQNLIKARLALVSARARQIVDVAAIIGPGFDFDTLWRASGLDQDGTLDALDELLRAQLAQQQAGDNEPYEFTHSKIREVVNGEMSLARQRILHRRVGEAMEMTHREQLADIHGVIAVHFRVALEWKRAAHHALLAGEHAFSVSAPQEAVEYYGTALEALSHLVDRATTARVYSGMGMALSAMARQDRSLESYNHALAIYRDLGDIESIARVQFGMAQTHLLLGEYRQASELAQDGLAELRALEHSSPRVTARGLTLWGTALSMGGRSLAEAERHLEEAVETFSREGDHAGLVQPQFELGNIAAQKGDLNLAVMRYEQALESASRGKELMFEALASNNAAYHRLLLGDVVGARDLVERGLGVAELHHIVPALVYLYSTAAEIQIANRNWDRAEEYLNPGLAIAETLNHQERRAGYMANMAEVSWGRGHRDAAIEQLARAAQMVDDIGVRYASARHHLRLAELRSEYGNRAEAAAHLQRATQIAHEGSFGSLLAQAEALKTKIRAETES